MALAIDFHAIRPEHSEADRRLTEWGRWCHGTPAAKCSPMFRSVKPSQQWEAAEPRDTIDPVAAQQVERIVAGLPASQSKALRWSYVWRWSPGKAARLFDLTLEQLADAVEAGRGAVASRL